MQIKARETLMTINNKSTFLPEYLFLIDSERKSTVKER